MAQIVIFPRRPIDPDRVRSKAAPALVLILPVIRIERQETPAQRLGRFLDLVLDSELLP